jgi:hypothetical protein
MAIDKIIREIKRIAVANGGKAPGVQIFERETGLKRWDWYPDIWLRWGDALEEAGYASNQLQTRIDDQVVIERYISLVRELGRFPVVGEIKRSAFRAEGCFWIRLSNEVGTTLQDWQNKFCRASRKRISD